MGASSRKKTLKTPQAPSGEPKTLLEVLAPVLDAEDEAEASKETVTDVLRDGGRRDGLGADGDLQARESDPLQVTDPVTAFDWRAIDLVKTRKFHQFNGAALYYILRVYHDANNVNADVPEADRLQIAYRSASEGKEYVRSALEFFAAVEVNGVYVPRFTPAVPPIFHRKEDPMIEIDLQKGMSDTSENEQDKLKKLGTPDLTGPAQSVIAPDGAYDAAGPSEFLG